MHRARCYQVFQQSWWFDSECEFSERATACCMLLLLPMLRWMKDVLLRLDGRNSHSFSFSSLLFFPVLLWESSWALFWHNIQHLQSQKSKRTTQTKRYCNRSWRAVSYPSFVFLTAVARSVCMMPSAGGCLKKGGMGIYYPATCIRIRSYYLSNVLRVLSCVAAASPCVLDHAVTCSQSEVFAHTRLWSFTHVSLKIIFTTGNQYHQQPKFMGHNVSQWSNQTTIVILRTYISTLAPLLKFTHAHHEIMLNLFPTSHRAAWKKFFALKEEERGEEEEAQGQQAQLEHEEESVGRAMLHSSGPVQSEEAIRARKHFLKESQRWNTHRENMLSSWAPPAPPSRTENEILQRPNIEIPVNGVPCTIAQ